MASSPVIPSEDLAVALGGPPDDAIELAPDTQNFRYRSGAGNTLVIACGAIAREIVALIERNGWHHIELTCLPAIWHNHPERIPDGIRRKIREARSTGRYGTIFVGYGDCGTGGLLDKVLAEEGDVARLPGPHCYAFFTGTDAFMAGADDEIDAFYLTDYLAKHFQTLIWRGFGIEKHPELRDMFFIHYRKVVYLAQTDNPSLLADARAAAEQLQLPLEVRHVGYGDLTGALAGLTNKSEHADQRTPPPKLVDRPIHLLPGGDSDLRGKSCK